MAKKNRDETSRSERAAQIRAEQARKDRNRNILVGVAVLVVVSALIAAAVIFSPEPKSAKVSVRDIKASVSKTEFGMLVGPESAPHKVQVHEDFQCPYCREFETASRTWLHDAAAAGKVSVEYLPINLPNLDPYSADAFGAWYSVLANGEPKQALQMHDILFDKQPYETAGAKPGTSDMEGWAKKIGVSGKALDGIKNPDKDFMKKANDAAQAKGISSTPTVTLDGKKLEGSPADMFAQIQKAVNGS